MTLFDAAENFKNQLADCQYTITTAANEITVKTFPRNFMHLIGLQRTYEFEKIKNISNFFYDCLNKNYLMDISQYTYKTTLDRNTVDMKFKVLERIEKLYRNGR